MRGHLLPVKLGDPLLILVTFTGNLVGGGLEGWRWCPPPFAWIAEGGHVRPPPFAWMAGVGRVRPPPFAWVDGGGRVRLPPFA